MKSTYTIATVALTGAIALSLVACKKDGAGSAGSSASAAQASYVAPGQKDEYYLFYSGGHSDSNLAHRLSFLWDSTN